MSHIKIYFSHIYIKLKKQQLNIKCSNNFSLDFTFFELQYVCNFYK